MASRTPLSSASASGSTAVSRKGNGNGISATREVPRSCVDTTNSDSLRSSTVSVTRPAGSGKRTSEPSGRVSTHSWAGMSNVTGLGVT